MADLRGILKESSEYYRDLERRIVGRLRDLPKGSVFRRRIGSSHYFYLKIREGRRVMSRYLGKARPVALEKAVEERRLLRRQLREVRQSMRLLSRVGGRRSGKPA